MNNYPRRRMREQWVRLSDRELDGVEGQAGRLLSLLQDKYGYTRHRAEARTAPIPRGPILLVDRGIPVMEPRHSHLGIR
jgi:hypothetical protein